MLICQTISKSVIRLVGPVAVKDTVKFAIDINIIIIVVIGHAHADARAGEFNLDVNTGP